MATKKITVSVPDITKQLSYEQRSARDQELFEVKEELTKVLTKAVKKHKTTSEANKFMEELTKSISDELGSQLISVKLLVLQQSVQAILPDIISTITEEAAKFNKLRIVKETEELFKQETTSIMIKLLGMREDTWRAGKLEIDNWNGRQSAVSAFINSNAQPIITKIVKDELEAFDKKELPKIKASVSSALIKRIKEQVNESMYRTLTNHIEERANKITKQLVDEAVKQNDLYKSLCTFKPNDE